MVAPDDWITSFDSISQAGHKCLLDAAKTSAATIKQIDDIDVERIKNEVLNKCPEYSNFFNSISKTINSLPTSLINAIINVEFSCSDQFLSVF